MAAIMLKTFILSRANLNIPDHIDETLIIVMTDSCLLIVSLKKDFRFYGSRKAYDNNEEISRCKQAGMVKKDESWIGL